MTLRECYVAFDSDYDETLKRLCNEALMLKLLKKFPEDKSFPTLKDALASGDLETAFLAVHTLKGVALNMGFSSLAKSSSALTELLRSRTAVDYSQHLTEVERDYTDVIGVIRQLECTNM